MDYHGEPITVPTEGEILRIKGVLILKRNATRDYLDFVALADHMGDEGIAAALESFDRLYRQDNGESPLQQLQVQLANSAWASWRGGGSRICSPIGGARFRRSGASSARPSRLTCGSGVPPRRGVFQRRLRKGPHRAPTARRGRVVVITGGD